jgi:hypothetical protein
MPGPPNAMLSMPGPTLKNALHAQTLHVFTYFCVPSHLGDGGHASSQGGAFLERLEDDLASKLSPGFLFASSFEPAAQVLTLADIHPLQLATALDDGLHARTSNSHTSAHGKFLELQKVQADGAERRIRDGRTAE